MCILMKSFCYITLNFQFSIFFVLSHTTFADKQIKWNEWEKKIVSTLFRLSQFFFVRVHTFKELIIMCMHKYVFVPFPWHSLYVASIFFCSLLKLFFLSLHFTYAACSGYVRVLNSLKCDELYNFQGKKVFFSY